MDIIGLPLAAHVMEYWGQQLGGPQMSANGAFLHEHYVKTGKHGIMNGDPTEDRAEGFYEYPNPIFLRDDFLG